MAKEKLFHVGVKALIENEEGEILLLKAPGWKKNNTPPHWDIPGGRIQEGGDALGTLMREIEEETGITRVHSAQLFSAVISKHEIPLDDKILGLVLMIYKTKVPGNPKLKLSHEHTAFEWVDKKEAAKRLANKYPAEFTESLK